MALFPFVVKYPLEMQNAPLKASMAAACCQSEITKKKRKREEKMKKNEKTFSEMSQTGHDIIKLALIIDQ